MNAQKISTTLSFLTDVAHASLQVSDASAGIIVQLDTSFAARCTLCANTPRAEHN